MGFGHLGMKTSIKSIDKQDFDPKTFLASPGKGRTLADYAKNDTIFRQGDPADALFYIHKGKIKLTVVSKQGKEAVVALLGGGDFFGEGCLTGRPIAGSRADVPGNIHSVAEKRWAGQSVRVASAYHIVRLFDPADGKGSRDPAASRAAGVFRTAAAPHALPQHSD